MKPNQTVTLLKLPLITTNNISNVNLNFAKNRKLNIFIVNPKLTTRSY